MNPDLTYLYNVAKQTLGIETNQRKRRFMSTLRLYYPWENNETIGSHWKTLSFSYCYEKCDHYVILILNSIGYSSELTILGAAIFFWSRLVYIICYIFGIPIIRTFSFIAGWFGTLIFMYEIFSSIKHVG